jgi:mRNA interferase HigB
MKQVNSEFSINACCSQYGNNVYFDQILKCETLRVISRKTLVQFWTQHSDAEQPLKAWFKEAEKAQWDSPVELKHYYPTASILNSNRVVFNIKGNKYRLITMINFDYGQVFIRFVGTHAEYDKIDATRI